MTTRTYAKYASVILDVSINKCLDYAIPENLLDEVYPGVKVSVPIRGHARNGYIFEIKDHSNFSSVQPIISVDSGELVSKDLFELAIWMAKYYCCSLREVLKIMLPAIVRKDTQHKQQLFVMRAKTREEIREFCEKQRNKYSAQVDVLEVFLKIKKGILLSELLEKTKGSRSPIDSLVKKGFLAIDIVRIDRSPLVNEEYFQTKAKVLNPDQEKALSNIQTSLSNEKFETHLLYGITGSGKTEVYLQAIEHAMKLGKSTIMLVPEIALTEQTIERFRSRFEGDIAILHHRLSAGERFDEWHKIKRGEAKIVIGARSAVFSPVMNLGLIIIDEEHENSYKQSDDTPCYHARDVAVMRCKMTNSTVILGSATPSIESYYNAQNGKYKMSSLFSRADTASLPKVQIVDMQKEFEKNKGFTSFSEALLKGIKNRQEIGEQTILFLNRRGYHTTLLCQQCNIAVRCNHCEVAMTFHLGANSLACHLCGFCHTPPPQSCPGCKSPNPMKFRGVGTELIQKSLHAIFPEVRSLRIDADTTKHKGSLQKLLRDFATGKADVMIGTQMIAKGLHFPQVTLVGVLNSDSSINIPDFRASETVFQLITQVAGRSGRGNVSGEVIIQTSMPENDTIQLASTQEYQKFFATEIETRKLFNYPPFTSIVKIAFSGLNSRLTSEIGEQIRHALMKCLTNEFEIHALIPAGHAKIKDKYRFQFLVRGPNIYMINKSIENVRKAIHIPKNIKMFVDVNPTSTYF